MSWPKASEGGKVVGKAEVRAYWTRQWAAFDPHVEPLETKNSSPLWRCPKCGGKMVVIERLTAAQIQLRSSPWLAGAAA
ncbi:MAG TPA: hypothetical protein VKB49_05710 [Candidatus Sulfotelmatobacter sp.]|nr:hypothetical protein [Candidatus Sulfotelmatobacter sp.]